MSNLAQARSNMVEGQLRPNQVVSEPLIKAISAVNREKFVPKNLNGVAYIDEDIEVVPGRFIMEPMVFGRLVEVAHVKPTDLVLDIGCATGYSTAVFCRLSEAVVGLEETDDLVEMATSILSEEACDNVAVVKGALNEGLAAQGPYDLIFINGQVDEIPQTLLDQLAEGGRLICVLNENGIGKAVMVSNNEGIMGTRVFFDASVPELSAFSKKETFQF